MKKQYLYFIIAFVFIGGIVHGSITARSLLGNAKYNYALDLAGRKQEDSNIVQYLLSRDCHRERPYSIRGMNAEFRRRLASFLHAGDTVGYRMYILSGKRTPTDQEMLALAYQSRFTI